MNTIFTYGTLVLQILVAAVLTLAGISKLLAPRSTSTTLTEYGISPGITALSIGLLLSVVELLTAFGLFFRGTQQLAAVGAVSLFALFSVVLLRNLHHGETTSCGCFGPFLSRTPMRIATFRTVSFLFASVVLAILMTYPAEITSYTAPMFLTPTGITFALIGVYLTIAGRKDVHGSKINATWDKLTNYDRRTFLKHLFAMTATIVASNLRLSSVAASNCCQCQSYDHFDPGCCSSPVESRLHHYFKRCCNSCDGRVGFWHLQWQTCDYECFCVPWDEMCDVIHGCGGSACYQNECCPL